MILGNPDKNVRQKAERILETAAKTHGNDAQFLGDLAMLRLLEERNDEGIRLLRQVVALNPHDAVAMNNLAGALSDKAQTRAEAQQLIDSAIAQAGPLTEFLDTKAKILLLEGNVDGAIKLFEEATSRSSSDPRHLFHLAVALKQAGKLRESREALERAAKSGLDSARLTPTQRRQLAELEQRAARLA